MEEVDVASADACDEAPGPDAARLSRRTKLSLAVIILALPIVLWGAHGALLGLNDDAMGWTATNLPAKHDFQWFAKHFEAPDSIVVAWPGCTLDDPRLQRFSRSLTSYAPQSGSNGGSAWFPRVVTGFDVLQDMTSPPRNFSTQEAVERLKGVLIGPDRRATCAIVVLSEEASGNGRQVLRVIREVAQSECDLDPQELRLTGHVVETTALDTASLETLYHLCIPSALLTILVAWPFLRSLRLAVVVFLGASFCQCCSLSLVYYTGREMNGMMAVLPILVLGCFVSGAVHLSNYHLEALPQGGPQRAAAHAVHLGWIPCLLAVVTTAFGVGSLATSHVQPVYLFGIYGGIAILLVYVVLFLVMPGGLAWTSHREFRRVRAAAATSRTPRWLARWSWEPLAWLVGTHSTLVLLTCTGILAIGCAGVVRLRGSMQLVDFFPQHSRIISDHRWLEGHLGPLMPLEIVLGIEQGSSRTMIDRLRLVDRVEQSIRGSGISTSTLSLATFLPTPDPAASSRATIQRSVFNRRLEGEVANLAASTRYLAITDGRQWWRITVRLESLGGRPYEEMVLEVQEVVAQALAEDPIAPAHDIAVKYTGILPLLAASHPVLLSDLITSFGSSFAANAVVLAIGLLSLRLGMASILPNAFPIVLVFGALGWLGQSVDPGMMMTASVGLGIAVDNGVHYLTWYMRGLREGLAQQEATLNAYRHCGKAILRSTSICVAAMSVYVLSSFVPAARFGWLVCVLFLAALVGDLVFLPALLAGRLGRFLVPRYYLVRHRAP